MLADARQSCYVHQQMNKHKRSSTAQACGAQVASETPAQPPHQQIKLALDVHAASVVVARMIDGAKPQPPQTFAPPDFLAWAQKQVALAEEVVSCYEAGPTGFWLHRQLTALGVRNYVVCPTALDERHQGVVNDRTDALELATRLDRYVAGNDRALAVVRVPTEAEEQKRAHKRQRQQLRRTAAEPGGSGPQPDAPARPAGEQLTGGRRIGGSAWQTELAGWLVERLKVFRG